MPSGEVVGQRVCKSSAEGVHTESKGRGLTLNLCENAPNLVRVYICLLDCLLTLATWTLSPHRNPANFHPSQRAKHIPEHVANTFENTLQNTLVS